MDPNEMLKLNAKKLGDAPRAFFYAEDKGSGEQVLFIDRKFDNPKRYGNLKKVQAVVSKGFEVELSKKTKFCAGVAIREDGTIVFRPSIQKANAAMLKKGIKKLKKQLGAARVDLAGGDEAQDTGSGSAPDTGALEALLKTYMAGVDAIEALDGEARAAKVKEVAETTQAALDAIDSLVASAGGGEDALDIDVGGKPVSAWQDQLNAWQADSDDGEADDELDETLAEMEAQVKVAQAELDAAKQEAERAKARVDEGNKRLTDTALDTTLLSLLGGKDLGDLGEVLKGNPKLAQKLTEAISAHKESTTEVEISSTRLELSETRVEKTQAQITASQTKKAREEVSVRLTDTVLDRSLAQLARGKTTDLQTLTGKMGSVLSSVSETVTQDDIAQLEVERLTHLESSLTAKVTALEARKNLEKLEESHFSEKRKQTREVSRSILDEHHAGAKAVIAELRKAARGGDAEAADRLKVEEDTSRGFTRLKEMGLSLDQLTLRFESFTEQLGSLSDDASDDALSSIVRLRAEVVAFQQQLAQIG